MWAKTLLAMMNVTQMHKVIVDYKKGFYDINF